MIKYPVALKTAAHKLRNAGYSYKEISEKLKISKSTAKLWCGNIKLSPKHKKRLYTKQIEILSRGPKSSHERRKKEINEIIRKAENDIEQPVSFETYKLFGAALYWAEGSKTQHFSVANSDPFLIKFMTRWIEDVLGVKSEYLKAYLNIYPQQNDIEIKKFWSDLTGIPVKNFGKSFVKPANKNFKKNTLYYGTIKIRVPKGTDTRHKVFGWIKAVLKNLQPSIENTERKWHKLKTDYKRP
ncbi:MAG: hypothetical protein NUV83_02585 [Candidatus Wolfebacteria bacterium]|nr:hypothetical protein [Candidatus Wolfebacteria bacterium]